MINGANRELQDRLLISSVARQLDRKTVLVSLTLAMAASGAIVAASPSFVTFMVGRALLGVVIGGFWSMSAATAMRLVPKDQVARALAIFNGGNALATVVAAPLGAYLGSIIGWRGAFLCVVPLAVVALVWQLLSLPSMRVDRAVGPGAVFRVLNRPGVSLGMGAVGLLFIGQFALFTYIRPFLETVTGAGVSALSLLLLLVGVTGLIGTILIGGLIDRGLFRTLIGIPLLMALVAAALIAGGHWIVVTAVLLGLWGLLGTAAPVGWWTWLARALPDDAEAGGGLMVAVIQLAITLGATLGGVLYDTHGYQVTFGVAAALLSIGASVSFLVSSKPMPASTGLE